MFQMPSKYFSKCLNIFILSLKILEMLSNNSTQKQSKQEVHQPYPLNQVSDATVSIS